MSYLLRNKLEALEQKCKAVSRDVETLTGALDKILPYMHPQLQESAKVNKSEIKWHLMDMEKQLDDTIRQAASEHDEDGE